MPFKTLAPELVPLVHHIELAKAGWSLRLTEQLATAVACSSGQAASAADLRFSIEEQYGVRTTEEDVRCAVGTLAALVHNSRSRSIIALHPEIRGPA